MVLIPSLPCADFLDTPAASGKQRQAPRSQPSATVLVGPRGALVVPPQHSVGGTWKPR